MRRKHHVYRWGEGRIWRSIHSIRLSDFACRVNDENFLRMDTNRAVRKVISIAVAKSSKKWLKIGVKQIFNIAKSADLKLLTKTKHRNRGASQQTRLRLTCGLRSITSRLKAWMRESGHLASSLRRKTKSKRKTNIMIGPSGRLRSPCRSDWRYERVMAAWPIARDVR